VNVERAHFHLQNKSSLDLYCYDNVDEIDAEYEVKMTLSSSKKSKKKKKKTKKRSFNHKLFKKKTIQLVKGSRRIIEFYTYSAVTLI